MRHLLIYVSLCFFSTYGALEERTPLNINVQQSTQEILEAVRHNFSKGHQNTTKDKAMFVFSLGSAVLGTMPFFDLGYDMLPENTGGGGSFGYSFYGSCRHYGNKIYGLYSS